MKYLDEIDVTPLEFGDMYDELPLWSAPFGLMILDRVPIKSGLTILDVGAGTGFLTIELAERCGLGTTVIAVDPWTAGVARLRRKIEHRGLKNVVVLAQDAATIDLPSASVDVIVSSLGVNNFADPAAVLDVCARAAKPGATFLLATNLVGHMTEFYEVYRDVLARSERPDRVAALDAHINHRATRDSIGRLLASAGFKVIDVVTSSFRWRFADGSALLRHHFVRVGFVQEWKAIAAVGALEETCEQLERALNAVADRHGELALTIPMACFVAAKQSVGNADPDGAA